MIARRVRLSDARYSALVSALDELVTQMQHHKLWSAEQPNTQALASIQPFCVDTLSFEQWLQFVMLPTFMSMVECKQVLPSKCEILPMAEHVWQQQYHSVQACIKNIDRVISNGS